MGNQCSLMRNFPLEWSLNVFQFWSGITFTRGFTVGRSTDTSMGFRPDHSTWTREARWDEARWAEITFSHVEKVIKRTTTLIFKAVRSMQVDIVPRTTRRGGGGCRRTTVRQQGCSVEGGTGGALQELRTVLMRCCLAEGYAYFQNYLQLCDAAVLHIFYTSRQCLVNCQANSKTTINLIWFSFMKHLAWLILTHNY